jgi:hypothetical protein
LNVGDRGKEESLQIGNNLSFFELFFPSFCFKTPSGMTGNPAKNPSL